MDEPLPDPLEPEEEVVEGLPVLAEVRVLARTRPHPRAQVAAVAATGFVAGAAAAALMRRAGRRPPTALRPRSAPAVGGEVLATHSYLVDVHVIGRPAR